MIGNLYHVFIAAWILGLLALILGRYVGHVQVRFPVNKLQIFLVYVQVWGVTFIAQLAFSMLGHTLQWSESAQITFAEFLLPVVAGAYFARRILLLKS